MNTGWRYAEAIGAVIGVITATLIILSLGGCASMWQPKLDADQLKAIAADKNAGVICGTVTGMYGTVKYVSVNLDKSVIPNGAVTTDEQCRVTITTQKELKP